VRRGVDQDARARARLHGFSGGAGVAHGGELRVGAQRLWREPELLQQVRCDAGALLDEPDQDVLGLDQRAGPRLRGLLRQQQAALRSLGD